MGPAHTEPQPDEPSPLEARHNSASALAANALSQFAYAADDLDAAADVHEHVAEMAQKDIDNLSSLRDAASEAAYVARSAAVKIRALTN